MLKLAVFRSRAPLAHLPSFFLFFFLFRFDTGLRREALRDLLKKIVLASPLESNQVRQWYIYDAV